MRAPQHPTRSVIFTVQRWTLEVMPEFLAEFVGAAFDFF